MIGACMRGDTLATRATTCPGSPDQPTATNCIILQRRRKMDIDATSVMDEAVKGCAGCTFSSVVLLSSPRVCEAWIVGPSARGSCIRITACFPATTPEAQAGCSLNAISTTVSASRCSGGLATYRVRNPQLYDVSSSFIQRQECLFCCFNVRIPCHDEGNESTSAGNPSSRYFLYQSNQLCSFLLQCEDMHLHGCRVRFRTERI